MSKSKVPSKEVESDIEKTCFIIMPISDVDGYPSGHFKRVYDYLIKPACEMAGFKPVRADDVQNTNYIALDIVKRIINADMAICDLSARNPNVLYELGIRQAFNKPVTLIKDTITQRIFDISGFRDVEYDESLRIDTIQTSLPVIAETIKNTFDNKASEINSLISLLGIEPAKVEKNTTISNDTALLYDLFSSLQSNIKDLETKVAASVSAHLNQKELETHVFSKYGFKVGDKVEHQKSGKGNVKKLEGSIYNPIATIDYDESGVKKVMLNYSQHQVIVDDLPF